MLAIALITSAWRLVGNPKDSVIELTEIIEEDSLLPVSSREFSEVSLIAEVRNDFSAMSPGSVELSREPLISVIENYIRYYASGEGHTARAKRYDLQHFLEFLAAPSKRLEQVYVADWTRQATTDFVDCRLELGESPATVSRRLATLKHLGRTLAERIAGYINPAREVKGPTLQQSRPQGLTSEEINLLHQVAEEEALSTDHAFIQYRNFTLLQILLATGLRADEVRLLLLGQISDDCSWLKNVKTKGRKFRNVYLDSSIREVLRTYLQLRQSELEQNFPLICELSSNERSKFPVFVSNKNADLEDPRSFGLAPKTIWRIVADFGKKAALLNPKLAAHRSGLHPHRLRHTFAHGLLDSSKDVRLVAQALGHSDVRTTMRYTERSEEEIAKAIEEKVAKS